MSNFYKRLTTKSSPTEFERYYAYLNGMASNIATIYLKRSRALSLIYRHQFKDQFAQNLSIDYRKRTGYIVKQKKLEKPSLESEEKQKGLKLLDECLALQLQSLSAEDLKLKKMPEKVNLEVVTKENYLKECKRLLLPTHSLYHWFETAEANNVSPYEEKLDCRGFFKEICPQIEGSFKKDTGLTSDEIKKEDLEGSLRQVLEKIKSKQTKYCTHGEFKKWKNSQEAKLPSFIQTKKAGTKCFVKKRITSKKSNTQPHPANPFEGKRHKFLKKGIKLDKKMERHQTPSKYAKKHSKALPLKKRQNPSTEFTQSTGKRKKTSKSPKTNTDKPTCSSYSVEEFKRPITTPMPEQATPGDQDKSPVSGPGSTSQVSLQLGTGHPSVSPQATETGIDAPIETRKNRRKQKHTVLKFHEDDFFESEEIIDKEESGRGCFVQKKISNRKSNTHSSSAQKCLQPAKRPKPNTVKHSLIHSTCFLPEQDQDMNVSLSEKNDDSCSPFCGAEKLFLDEDSYLQFLGEDPHTELTQAIDALSTDLFTEIGDMGLDQAIGTPLTQLTSELDLYDQMPSTSGYFKTTDVESHNSCVNIDSEVALELPNEILTHSNVEEIVLTEPMVILEGEMVEQAASSSIQAEITGAQVVCFDLDSLLSIVPVEPQGPSEQPETDSTSKKEENQEDGN